MSGWRQVLTSNVMAPTLVALLIFGAFAIFLTRALAARALLAFGIGAALSAIAQAKGWPYHVLPALSAAILLATFTLSQTIDRYLPISRSLHRLPVAVISATLMVLLYFQAALYTPPFYKQLQYEDSIGGILRHIVEQNAPHRTIMTLSPGIYPFWPMLNYVNGRMTMRFLTMWVVQGVYADCEDFPALYNAPDTMGDTEKFVFDAVSEDFAKGQPDLLIARHHPRHAALPGQGLRLSRVLPAEQGLRRRLRALRASDGRRSLQDLPQEEALIGSELRRDGEAVEQPSADRRRQARIPHQGRLAPQHLAQGQVAIRKDRMAADHLPQDHAEGLQVVTFVVQPLLGRADRRSAWPCRSRSRQAGRRAR